MSKDTVTVDGEDYIFPPDQVCKPEKTTEKEDNILWNGGETQ
jgi:hypothetical protein